MNPPADDSPFRRSPARQRGCPENDVLALPPMREAAPHVLASARRTPGLVLSRRLHHPRHHIGRIICFADGSSSRVYRETRVGDGLARDPTLLVVGFVLRRVQGSFHSVFRAESWLNIPLFVGFPGFTSKLWLAHDQNGCYRGIYEWDGEERAAAYVRELSWVLGLFSIPGSIRAHTVPGIHREDVLSDPHALTATAKGSGPWWRPIIPPV